VDELLKLAQLPRSWNVILNNRILLVIARLNRGGTSRFIEVVTKELGQFGFEVKVVTGFVQGSEIEDEAASRLPIERIKTLGRRVAIRSDLKARQELRKIMLEFQPAIIYSHTFKAGLLARTIRLKDTKYMHCFHGHLLYDPEFKGFKRRLIVLVERILAKRTDLLITTGERVAEDLIKEGIGTPEQFHVVSPGVSISPVIDKDIARRKLGLSPEDRRPIVAWIARMEQVKAPFMVLEIAAALPQAIFVMAGGGSQLDALRQVKNPENLIILGWQDPELVNSVADIAISTSLNEGMPISLIESQLAGLPVVAMNVGSIAEVVIDQRTGFVCVDLLSQFIPSLRSLILDSVLREWMSVNAIAHASEKFSVATLAFTHLKLIEKLTIA